MGKGGEGDGGKDRALVPELEVGRGTRSTQAGTETLGKELASADPSLALLGEPQTSEPPTSLWKLSTAAPSDIPGCSHVCVYVHVCAHAFFQKRRWGNN